MRWPLILRRGDTLILAQPEFNVWRVDADARVFDSNVLASGRAGFVWMLDADGQFYDLTSIGLLPQTLLQLLRLSRRVERFQIGPPRALRVGELTERVASLVDTHEEAPLVALFRSELRGYASDHLWGRAEMRAYLRE
jgi:hypothetical protein